VQSLVPLLRLLPLALCLALLACAPMRDEAGPSRSTTSLTADEKLRVAEAAEAGGDGDLALSMYLAAAQSAPSDVPLQLRCADALARHGQYLRARQLLAERLRANPGQVDLTKGLALIYLVSGDPEHASGLLDRILAVKPDDPAALTDKGIALDLLRRHGDAQTLYRQALKISPHDPAINNDLALSMMLEGRVREAQEVLEPFRSAAAPRRLATNLDILHAANGQIDQSRPLADGQISNDELLNIARALGRAPDHPDATH
jgi:Flp pilus assembly protein TadD